MPDNFHSVLPTSFTDEIPPKETWVPKSSSLYQDDRSFRPEKAIDGLSREAFVSAWRDNQWLQVDFLAVVKVSGIKLNDFHDGLFFFNCHLLKGFIMAR